MNRLLMVCGVVFSLMLLSGCSDIPTLEEQAKPCLDQGGIPIISTWNIRVMSDCKIKG